MSNLVNYQQQDNFTTRLSAKVATGDTTINVQTNVSFAFSDPFYISVNPGLSNYEPMLVTGISGTVWTVTRAQARYTGDAGSAKTHAAGSTVIISDNQAAFGDIATAINTKLDQNGGNTTTTWDLQVSGSNFRHRLDAGDMKFTDDNQSEITLSTLAAGGGADEKAKVSVNDTTAGYLNGKLVAGDGITFTENNDGGDETLSISANVDSVSYTAGEDISANVPVAKNSTADEVINLFLEGIGSSSNFDTNTVDNISACYMSDGVVAVAYRDNTDTEGQVVAGIITSKGVSWGTPQAFNAADTTMIDIALISSNKVAIVYRDAGASNVGNCVVATLSGTTFTFGTETQFDSNAINYTSVCAIDSDKFLVAYYDTVDTQGEAIVATVSGTTPTFGSSTAFDTDVIAARISCCQLDTDKAIIGWFDNTNTDSKVRVASIATTTVSFPSAAVVFEGSASTGQICLSQTSTDTAFLSYVHTNNAYASVVTVSGTTPTVNTEAIIDDITVVISADERGPRTNALLSATLGVVLYTDNTNTYYTLCDISGTTVTPRVPVSSGKGDADWYGVATVGDGKRFFVAFDDDDNSSVGSSFVTAITGNDDSYIGISTSSATSGNSIVIQREGLLTGFSSLSIGSPYYATDGAITDIQTSVFIGVARDSDEMDLSSSDPSKLAIANERFYQITTTRAAADASGSESIVFPFSPTMIMFYNYGNPGAATNAKSIGCWTSSGTNTITTNGAGADSIDTTNAIVSDKDGTDSQKASASVSGMTLTLTWTKANSGEDANVLIVAYK